jgi:hypothetical protein
MEMRQNRLSSLESLHFSFFHRTPFLPPKNEKQIYRETSAFRFYRKKLEEKAAVMNAEVVSVKGQGAPIMFLKKNVSHNTSNGAVISAVKAKTTGAEFLEKYRSEIAALPAAINSKDYLYGLNDRQRQVFYTLLPLAASLKYRAGLGSQILKTNALIEETKRTGIEAISRIIL